MKKITDILLIIVFILIITIPQIVSWIVNEEVPDISKTENRKMHEKPVISLYTLTSFPKDFDNYYNDHLPFRTDLRQMWANINFDLFNATIDNRIIIGKNGWLFYREDNTIEQTQGIEYFTKKEKKFILEKLQTNINELRDKNIDTYVMVIPSKENIYKEFLPDSIPIKNNVTKAEDLINYIENNSDIDIIYPKEELLVAKEKYQIYRKYDTHWNKVGVLIGTISLQKKMNKNFSYDINNLKIKELEKEEREDLALFSGLDNKLSEKLYIPTDKNAENDENFYNENYRYQDEINFNSFKKRKILVIGDSFSEDMIDYLSNSYKKVVFVNFKKYTKDMIDKEKPHIVIIMRAERNSDTLSQVLL